MRIDPTEDLRRFRYHTGATLRPLASDEPCPVLFRDVGPEAMSLFLRGKLARLAGPFSPITYMRTAEYREPYTDHGRIGRLVFLNPKELVPWHSGVETIYVAHASRTTSPLTLGFVPGEIPLRDAARILNGVADIHGLKDAVGPAFFREAMAETLDRLDRLNAELAETEAYAEPLRRLLQSGDDRARDKALEIMRRSGVTEKDLCTAWHHLPADRRMELRESFCSTAFPSEFVADEGRGIS
jgi:hypothetical protein